MMTHVGCGGTIVTDDSVKYDYELDNGTTVQIPRIACEKCGVTITGDPMIESDDQN